MRIFLAGGTGVIGVRALPALVAAGHQVTAVARTEKKADLVRRLGGTPVAVDLFDRDAVVAAVADAVDSQGAVVNLATNIPPVTKSAKATAWATNDRIRTQGSTHLVDAALAARAATYIQESICFPYVDGGDEWITESHPVQHEGPFSGAAAAEANAARFAEASASGGTGVVLRFTQFYAPDASHTQFYNASLRKRLNPFIGPPNAYQSWIHADDAASAVVAALAVPSGTYNICDDEPLTRQQAGRAAALSLGVKPPHALPRLVQAATPSSAKLMMKSLRVSNQRFAEATGWAPQYPSIRGNWPGDGAIPDQTAGTT